MEQNLRFPVSLQPHATIWELRMCGVVPLRVDLTVAVLLPMCLEKKESIYQELLMNKLVSVKGYLVPI